MWDSSLEQKKFCWFNICFCSVVYDSWHTHTHMTFWSSRWISCKGKSCTCIDPFICKGLPSTKGKPCTADTNEFTYPFIHIVMIACRICFDCWTFPPTVCIRAIQTVISPLSRLMNGNCENFLCHRPAFEMLVVLVNAEEGTVNDRNLQCIVNVHIFVAQCFVG